MTPTSPTQLKDWIKKLSKEKDVSANIIMQNYMLERLLERISASKYKNNFVLKGRNAHKCNSWNRLKKYTRYGCNNQRILSQ